MTNSQAAASGLRTCSQYAVERTTGSLTTMTPSMRVRTTPLPSSTSATAKRAYPT